MRKDVLLIEVGTEELPPKALPKLAQSFADNIAAGLDKAGFDYASCQWFASPRRLAVEVTELAFEQPDKIVEKRGPAVSVAFDDAGNPTKAAQGWARGNGIEVKDAQRLVTDKGEWLLHKAEVKGLSLQDKINELLNGALDKLPIPKPMKWGSSKTQFIRPVHTLCVIYGEQRLDAEAFGIASSEQLQGHRFHCHDLVTLKSASDYLDVLEQNHVIADFARRREIIRSQLHEAALTQQAEVAMDEALLDEVTALVEWPKVYTATFPSSFLEVPKEALIYTMKDDQKYFPLLDKQGELLPTFAFVSNIDSKAPAQVIQGNEKVIRPRLSDAQFFFETDKKHSLASRVNALDGVLFQKQLGSIKARSERIAKMAAFIGAQIGADIDQCERAGLLCKTDLMTNMVMEFPEVQGTMGKYYALNDGEPIAVAQALEDQYKPRFAGDALPQGKVGMALALAEKLDTLVGIFGIGQLPKGDKDPFALRRAAIGVLRIIVESGLELDIQELIQHGATTFADTLSNKDVVANCSDFILGRFTAWYQEQGVDTRIIQSVMIRRPTAPLDFDARIKAVQHFMSLEEAASLAAANKRVANILNKNQLDHSSTEWQPALLQEPQERTLAHALEQVKAQLSADSETDYTGSLAALARLKVPVDAFFDAVMVMAEDPALRNNRLALLHDLRQQFLRVADISVLG